MDTSDISELRICRVCLATDVKLYNLLELNFAYVFNDLLNIPVSQAHGLPQYLCYYCRAQLKRCALFRDSASKTHQYLLELRNSHLSLSTELIRNLYTTNFSSPLSKSRNTIIDYIPQEIIKESDQINNEIKVETITEYANENESVKGDELSNDDSKSCDDELPLSKLEFEKNNYHNVYVKSELDNNEILTEPPSKQDRIKRKHKKAKIKAKKQKNIRDKKEKDPKRKCNKYNEKFENDFVEFAKLHSLKVVCLSKEEQIKRVNERKESKEYKESRFSCDVCYKAFMSVSAYNRHMKGHAPSSGPFVCDVCSLRYDTQHRLNAHARSHKKIFVCTLCDQVNVTTSRAKLHSQWHKGIKFECKICNKEFNAHTTYLSHMRELHKPATCADCGETLAGAARLHRHRNIVHKQCVCSSCDVVFRSPEALERHRSDRCDSKTFGCVVCGENFPRRGDVTAHMKLAHSNDSQTYTCEQCSAVFVSDRALGIHFANAHYSLRSLTRDKQPHTQYLCEWCAKSFPTAIRLKLHHQLHTGDRPHQCPVCPKRLKTKQGLEFHINSHTGARPYKCRLCPEMFKSHAHRHNHHLMKHTLRERRHACTSCNKCFLSACELRKHVRHVHLKLPRHPHTPT